MKIFVEHGLLAILIVIGLVCSLDAKIKRSSAAVRHFKKSHVCPSTGVASSTAPCPGYVVDHIKPLECGGPDKPENMQYQSTEEAKAKDKLENSCCKKGLATQPVNPNP